MAAPATCTLKELNSDMVMNKSLSDDFGTILAFQGIGWLTRKAITMATVTLHISQYKDEEGVEHIDIKQSVTGGFEGTTELRTLDNTEKEHVDHVFGKVKGRSRWVKLSEVEDEFLKKGWLPEMNEGEVIESYAESREKIGWKATQIWGFQDVNGERRYCRNVVVHKGDEKKTARLVYDYKPKTAPAS